MSLQLSSEQSIGVCLDCAAGPEESSTSEVQRLHKFGRRSCWVYDYVKKNVIVVSQTIWLVKLGHQNIRQMIRDGGGRDQVTQSCTRVGSWIVQLWGHVNHCLSVWARWNRWVLSLDLKTFIEELSSAVLESEFQTAGVEWSYELMNLWT